MPGVFITFEGGEGAGKSTQIKGLADKLRKAGHEVLLTREPGGSAGAEAIRHVLLSGAAEPFGTETEVLLFTAARLDHMQETILPALRKNAIVLCDRFYDSTRAYQGGSGKISVQYLKQMQEIAVGDNHPDLTIILDIDPELGLARVNQRIKDGKPSDPQQVDRFEKDELDVHKKRREAFLTIAKSEPCRCMVVDASQNAEMVSSVIWALIQSCLKEKGISGKKGEIS